MLRRIAILLVSLLFTTASWGVELGDIAQIMKSAHPDLAQAESLSRQFITQKPNTTKGRYYLAMVLERKGEPKEALQALHEAQKLDPALKFASSPARFYSQESKLSAMAARQTAPATHDNVATSFKVREPLPHTALASAPARPRTEFAQTTTPARTGGSGFLLVVGALAALGALAWLLVTKAKSKKEDAAKEKLKTEQQAELLDSTKRLDTVILSARADQQVKLQHAAEDTRLTVGHLLEKLKRDDTLASTYDMSTISQRIARYESLLNSGLDFEPAATVNSAHATPPSTTSSQQSSYEPPAPAQHYSPSPQYPTPPAPYSAPPTVVVHRDTSTTDLLLAAGLGMALSGNHRNDSRVERETVYVREPQHDRYAAQDAEVRHRNEYVEPARALEFDAGGEDSGSTQNFDTGGADSPDPEPQDAPEPASSNDDSFDSGGDDNS